LITAADGAIEFYNLEDNRIRYEINPSEAIRVDKALRKAYSGHPDWLIIDNSEVGFDRKMQKLGLSFIQTFRRSRFTFARITYEFAFLQKISAYIH
jgi:hypothetical protein